jgi:predicted O-methyltransferase YrrM
MNAPSVNPSTTTLATRLRALLQHVGRAHRSRVLRSVIRELRLQDRQPTVTQLRRLRYAFGNRQWAASIPVMQELCQRVADARHGVLECGCGASTLLIGALTWRRRLPVVSLEHVRLWRDKTDRLLRSLGLDHVSVRYRPIARHSTYNWYKRPALRPERKFDVVFVDGPPGALRGGRYGFLPTMLDSLTDDCVILLDDADRVGEKQVALAWHAELPASALERHGTYAVIARRPRGSLE